MIFLHSTCYLLLFYCKTLRNICIIHFSGGWPWTSFFHYLRRWPNIQTTLFSTEWHTFTMSYLVWRFLSSRRSYLYKVMIAQALHLPFITEECDSVDGAQNLVYALATYYVHMYLYVFNCCHTNLFVPVFLSFEAGIANAISYISEKRHLPDWIIWFVKENRIRWLFFCWLTEHKYIGPISTRVNILSTNVCLEAIILIKVA